MNGVMICTYNSKYVHERLSIMSYSSVKLWCEQWKDARGLGELHSFGDSAWECERGSGSLQALL